MEKIKNNAILRRIALVAILALISALMIFAITANASTANEELSIDYCNLSFRDRVTVKYAVDAGGSTDVNLLIFTDKTDSYAYGTQKYILEPVGKDIINEKEYLIFDFNELSAKQMTDTVYAVAYVEHGGQEIYSAPNKYSILQYAYNMLGKTKPSSADAELKALLQNMLEYGASAQLWFDYKEERLATADFYQVVLDGGLFDDGFKHGLFLEGETVTISAPLTNEQGENFTAWIDSTGKVVSTDPTAIYTVGSSNATVLAQYSQNTAGIEYSLKSDGTYEVVGYNGNSKYLYVPAEHEGKSVTSVKSNALYGNTTIEYLSLPDTVTNVGNGAFKGCVNLKSAYLGSSLEVMGNECLSGTAITELVIPDSVKVIGQGALKGTPLSTVTLPFIGGSRTTSNAYLGYIFGGSQYGANASVVPATLNKVILSDAATAIPANAFFGCESIGQVVIGSSVKKIGINAFKGMTAMESIYIPESVTAVLANAEAHTSPFYGCNADLMIVLEKTTTSSFGAYWNYVTDGDTAFTIYMKTYEDYLKNGDSYRVADPTDASLSVLLVNGELVDEFSPDVYSYTVTADINKGYGSISAVAASASAAVVITEANAHNGGVATIVVTSKDGNTTKTYTVTFELTGSFNASAEVVNKNNAQGAVTFVIDDGDITTATFSKEMLDKYQDLKLTYAIITDRLVTLTTEYDSATGKYNYVMTPDGRYTYTTNTNIVNFWLELDLYERVELTSHTHSHAFWGINDDGGVQQYVDNSGNIKTSSNLPVGSFTAQLYAAKQVLEDLFGDEIKTLVEPGIGVKTTDVVIDGVTYETYYTYYKQLVEEAMANGELAGIRATFGAGSATDFSSRVITKDTLASDSARLAIPAMMVTHNDSVSQWKTYIDNAMAKNGWAAFCIHKISAAPTSGHYILESAAEEIFAYAAEKNVWMANFTEATLYFTEWASANVSVSYTDGSISVTLTDDEDNDLFNEALTVKVSVPANWSGAVANGEALEIMTDADGSSYVLVNIVPDSGSVTVSAIA